VDLNLTREELALHPLRSYLAARGLHPGLASGPVGARYLARLATGEAATPAEAFDRWFSKLLGGAPAGEAEGVGWIAFLLAGARPEDLLGELTPAVAEAIARRAPRPARETPLAMPVQDLRRTAGRRTTAGEGLLATRSRA
jgi:hypothetical protein